MSNTLEKYYGIKELASSPAENGAMTYYMMVELEKYLELVSDSNYWKGYSKGLEELVFGILGKVD